MYIAMLYICAVILTLMDKIVKFEAFHSKTQEFAVVGQIREFCKYRDGRKIFTALIISKAITFYHYNIANRHYFYARISIIALWVIYMKLWPFSLAKTVSL